MTEQQYTYKYTTNTWTALGQNNRTYRTSHTLLVLKEGIVCVCVLPLFAAGLVFAVDALDAALQVQQSRLSLFQMLTVIMVFTPLLQLLKSQIQH